MNANKPVAELALEQMAVGDASSLRVKWLTDSYPPVGTQLYTNPVKEQDGCGNCHACLVGVTEHGLPVTFQRMILCPDCGNKRCPKASNHRHQCTESNEPNQRGSIYTHPAELTDEEINIVGIKVLGSIWNCYDEELVEFARAILRKAQEQ